MPLKSIPPNFKLTIKIIMKTSSFVPQNHNRDNKDTQLRAPTYDKSWNEDLSKIYEKVTILTFKPFASYSYVALRRNRKNYINHSQSLKLGYVPNPIMKVALTFAAKKSVFFAATFYIHSLQDECIREVINWKLGYVPHTIIKVTLTFGLPERKSFLPQPSIASFHF